MEKRKTLYHLAIRIGILLWLLIGVFVIYRNFIYDANPYTTDTDPFILALYLTEAYCLFLLLEMIYFFVKKNKNLALINLIVFILIEVTPLLVLIQLTVTL